MYLKAEAWKKEIDLDCLCKEFIFEEEEAVAACGWRMCKWCTTLPSLWLLLGTDLSHTLPCAPDRLSQD